MRKDLENEILASFYKRAPNILTLENILFDLEEEDSQQVEGAIINLCKTGRLKSTINEGRAKPHYELPSYENIPIRQSIDIGSIKAPRLLGYDKPRPEDINIFFEALAIKTLELEAKFEERLDKKLREYWSNIIVLFGIFVAVFSIIVTFVGKVEVKQDSTYLNIFLINCAQVLPIAIVLSLFLLLLKKLFVSK